MSATKRCRKCGEEKPLGAFGVQRRASDGLNGTCRECVNAYHRRRNGGSGKPPEQNPMRRGYAPGSMIARLSPAERRAAFAWLHAQGRELDRRARELDLSG
ncbi:MAG: hypothetical protein ABR529_13995 [Actinomycetota bacterium]